MNFPTKPLPWGAPRFGVALPRGPRKSNPLTTEMPPAPRRVREQAREAAALMVFSALTSVAFATALMVVGHLGQRG
jgi:hypothetical protein